MGADTDVKFRVHDQADPHAKVEFLPSEVHYIAKLKDGKKEESKEERKDGQYEQDPEEEQEFDVLITV